MIHLPPLLAMQYLESLTDPNRPVATLATYAHQYHQSASSHPNNTHPFRTDSTFSPENMGIEIYRKVDEMGVSVSVFAKNSPYPIGFNHLILQYFHRTASISGLSNISFDAGCIFASHWHKSTAFQSVTVYVTV